MGVAIASLAAIPLGVLIGALRDPTLCRRSRFWLRFAGLVTCIGLPWLVDLSAGFGEDVAWVLLLAGLGWALLLVALAPLLLFRRPDSDPGSSDDADGGPGPGDGGRSPQRPIGGIPLPDAEQSASRVRGPHTARRIARRRRAGRERERRPSRLSPLVQ